MSRVLETLLGFLEAAMTSARIPTNRLSVGQPMGAAGMLGTILPRELKVMRYPFCNFSCA